MARRPLRGVDLFSGVGGMAVALAGRVTPVAYCEIDARCQRVLEARMKDGSIPRGVIHPDVRVMQPPKKVDVVVCTPACVGFSGLGKHEGFKEAQSGLFRHVLRIVDATSPRYVFIENVPGIVFHGLGHVTKSFRVRGYGMRWCCMSAAHVGAPHERKRFFALAFKPGSNPLRDFGVAISKAPKKTFWESTPEPPRMEVPVDGAARAGGCAAMGNAVVPQAVLAALETLCRLDADGSVSSGATRKPKKFESAGVLTPDGRVANAVREAAACMPAARRRDVAIVFDPKVYKSPKPPAPSLTSGLVKAPVTATAWSTPRHGMVSACNYLTARSVRDLPTQVRFARDTKGPRDGQVTARFCEYVMGFKPGWTAT